MRGSMGELVGPCHIACRKDVGIQRFQIVVGGHGFCACDAQFFQTEAGQPSLASHRAQQRVELDAAHLPAMLHHDEFAFPLFLAAHRLVTRQYLYPIGCKCRTRQLGDFDVFARHDARAALNLRDLRTQPRETLCQLATDRPTTQHHQTRRCHIQLCEFLPQRVAGHITDFFNSRQRRHEGPRAGGDNDAARGECLRLAIIQLDFHRPRIGDTRIALQHFHAETRIAFHAVVRRNFSDHAMHARHHLAEAEIGYRRIQAVMFGVTHLVREFCTLDERLAWHAAIVQAIAAHLVCLDQRHFSFHYRRDISRHQPRRPAADNDQIAVKSGGTLPSGINAPSLQPGGHFFREQGK